MKSIKRNFERIVEENPYWSTYICFAETANGKGFSKQTISRWFNKLVDKDDYEDPDGINIKKAVLRHLYNLSVVKKELEDD